ncbi:prenyltransferase [Culicoidibacter larvae]|uniref:Prenyltransferase n=1 Tax=Culicoidibacter larvae TaxID=2579976 RepID=A0A5R8Q8S9_9FIRM|nr:prenyltransferase [Culicoidibacter larvae]TLG72122.1 prenyltransferase [Culicoidibacter larvae]
MDTHDDIQAILAHRYDRGWDFWTSPDRRIIAGAPFSTLESAGFLLELGMPASDPILQSVSELFFDAWQTDGQFKPYPKGATYPCMTTECARLLCQLGYVNDQRIQKTLSFLLTSQHYDGGWRCNKFYYGHGPETEFSNPLPTLFALDCFRYTENYQNRPELTRAIEFLLSHWDTKRPIGPCHYGIGKLFMQVEYPFRGYNLFQYVYILSFYPAARSDERFKAAFAALKAKTKDEQIIVERVVPKLAKLNFCKKGEPSILATKRYQEILTNLVE